MRISSLCLHVFVLLFFVSLQSSCGTDDLVYRHDKPKTFLNGQDGLTVKENGKKSLVAAMRKGDREARVEALWRPIRFSLLNPPKWCSRLVDHQNRIHFAACANAPKQWRNELGDGFHVDTKEDTQALILLVREMYETMKSSSPPEGKEEAWARLLYTIKEFFMGVYDPLTNNGSPPIYHDEVDSKKLAGIPLKERRNIIAKNTDTDTDTDSDSGAGAGAGADTDSDSDAGTDSDSDADADADAVDEPWPSSSPVSHVYPPFTQPTVDFLGNINVLAQGGSINGKVHPSHLVWAPDFEFKQKMELFSQRASFGALKTKSDHSAARITVFYRKINSDDEWDVFARRNTANHGAEPGDRLMKQYATCDNFPITKGYFAWKGDCEGPWLGHHVCNDDTAYQIWHAYGNWNGGEQCGRRHNYSRPWCHEPYAGNAADIAFRFSDPDLVRSVVYSKKGVKKFEMGTKKRWPLPQGWILIYDPSHKVNTFIKWQDKD